MGLPRACLVLIGVLGVLGVLPRVHGLEESRAFWLTRWNARHEAEIVSCLDGMVALHANLLFCQVYGDGMALYRSGVAPRSPLVSGSFDALETAVREGHRRGIQVHAYVNVCNVYSGGLGQPADPAHLVRAHRGWAVVDSEGSSDADLVGTAGAMVFFCPEWDGFREYSVAIAREIASGYDVDGIHLDYLRFPGGVPRCFCAEHRRKFVARWGRAPAHSDPDFVEFRFETIARLFGEIHDAVRAVDPAIAISASLIASGDRYFQDGPRVLEAGKLDMAVPMLYTSDLATFEAGARWLHERSGGRLVLSGISVASSEGRIAEEVLAARGFGLDGQAIFAWSNLDDAGRAALASLWAGAATVPRMPWRDGSADLIPPVVSAAEVAVVTPEGAVIAWHTDERSRGAVEHGPTAALGSRVEEASAAFEHAVRLEGLRASTTYRYRIVATDPTGNMTRTDVSTFRTSAPGPVAVVVDDGDPSFVRGGSWSAGGSPGGNDGDYLFSSARAEESAWAEFRPYLPDDGQYGVDVWYVAGSNRVSDASFRVVRPDGTRAFLVDQTAGGGRWNRLGTLSFLSGRSAWVRLSNLATGGSVVIADAVRFELLEAEPTFVRGDANSDSVVDMSDAVAILGYLFLGVAEPACFDAADANDSGAVDLSDASYLLGHLFLGATEPPPPYPGRGTDRTPDALPECR